jgi:hypothetical protein
MVFFFLYKGLLSSTNLGFNGFVILNRYFAIGFLDWLILLSDLLLGQGSEGFGFG